MEVAKKETYFFKEKVLKRWPLPPIPVGLSLKSEALKLSRQFSDTAKTFQMSKCNTRKNAISSEICMQNLKLQ